LRRNLTAKTVAPAQFKWIKKFILFSEQLQLKTYCVAECLGLVGQKKFAPKNYNVANGACTRKKYKINKFTILLKTLHQPWIHVATRTPGQTWGIWNSLFTVKMGNSRPDAKNNHNFFFTNKSRYHVDETKSQNWRACDYMYFNFLEFNKTLGILQVNEALYNRNQRFPVFYFANRIYIAETKIAAVQNMGIKATVQFFLEPKEPDLMIITNSPSKREKLVKSILDIVQSRNMDGFFLAWKFPQCVMVRFFIVFIVLPLHF
jgi:hypothetical protein